MKKLLVIPLLLLCLTTVKIKAQASLDAHLYEAFIVDTIKPGATDSIIYFTSKYDLEKAYDLQITLITNQLTGTATGTAYLQFLPKSGLTWVDYPSTTMNITGTLATTIWSVTLQGGKYRIKWNKGAGVTTVKCRAWTLANSKK